MRRATATDQFNFIRKLSMLIYLQYNFGENSLFKCASQTEIAKNPLNALFCGFGRSRSSVFKGVGTPGQVVSTVLVIISSKTVSNVYMQPFSC